MHTRVDLFYLWLGTTEFIYIKIPISHSISFDGSYVAFVEASSRRAPVPAQILCWRQLCRVPSSVAVIRLAASSGKRNVKVWRRSVRPSVASAYSPWLTRGQHATRSAYITTIKRTDVPILSFAADYKYSRFTYLLTYIVITFVLFCTNVKLPAYITCKTFIVFPTGHLAYRLVNRQHCAQRKVPVI